MANTTGDDGGYADYTNNSATVVLGNSYSLTFSCGFSGSSYTEYWTIWIDYNQDGIFSDNEEVVFGSSSSDANLSSDITIPLTASLGTTRMRVSMKYDGESTSCESFTYGEVEDYTVIISDTETLFETFVAPKSETIGHEASYILTTFPNPATSFIEINIDNRNTKSSYSISNTTGQTVLKGNLINKNINISSLHPGIYILDATDGQKI